MRAPLFFCPDSALDAIPGCTLGNLKQLKCMKRFEYDVVYMKTEVTDVSSQGAISHHVRKVLNKLGQEGWDLVSVAQDQEQVRLFMKRELPERAP